MTDEERALPAAPHAYAQGCEVGAANASETIKALVEALEAAHHFVEESSQMHMSHLRLERERVLPIVAAALSLVRKGV